MLAIDWLKSRNVYVRTMERLKFVKKRIKNYVKILKEKYFSKKSSFVTKVKNLYTTIKASLKK